MNGHKITDVDQGGSKYLVALCNYRDIDGNRLSSDGDSLIDLLPGIIEAHPNGRIYAKCVGVLTFLSSRTHLSIQHPGYSSRIGCSSGQQHQRPVGTGDDFFVNCEARISNRHPCNRASHLVGLLIKDDASRNCNIRDRQGGVGELNSQVGSGRKSLDILAEVQHPGSGIEHDLYAFVTVVRDGNGNSTWKISIHTSTCDPQTHSFAIHDKIRIHKSNLQQRPIAIAQREPEVREGKLNDGLSRILDRL